MWCWQQTPARFNKCNFGAAANALLCWILGRRRLWHQFGACIGWSVTWNLYIGLYGVCAASHLHVAHPDSFTGLKISVVDSMIWIHGHCSPTMSMQELKNYLSLEQHLQMQCWIMRERTFFQKRWIFFSDLGPGHPTTGLLKWDRAGLPALYHYSIEPVHLSIIDPPGFLVWCWPKYMNAP